MEETSKIFIKPDGFSKRTLFSFQSNSIEPEKAKYVRYVREAGGLGDIIRFTAVGQGLKKKYPNARVHLFGPYQEMNLIIPRASHAIDAYFPCQYHSRERDILIDKKRHKHLDVGIKYDVTIDGWCPPYLHEPATQGLVAQDRVELWCRSAELPFERPYFVPTKEDFCSMEKYRKKHTGKIIGIQPGATCRSREWPYRHWRTLLEKFKKDGIHVVLFDVCTRVFQEIPSNLFEPSINKNWTETVGKILATDLMVTPDSGFYHLSGMLKKKCLGLFGCTNGVVISRPWKMEQITGHYLQLEHDQIDYSKLPVQNGCGIPCNPKCYMQWCRGWDSDRYRKQGKYCELMEQLTPEIVYRKAMELLWGSKTELEK